MSLNKSRKISMLLSTLLLSNTFCSYKKQQSQFVQTVVFNANNPIEDRHCFQKLKSIKGFTASVFDGHGGDLTSQYASKNLNQFLDRRIQRNLSSREPIEKIVEKSLIEAYQDVENGFFEIFKKNISSKAYQTVGSCALTAVILKNNLIIANAGDCQGVILSDNQAAMTNLRLNAGQKFQQARLFKKFPAEEDIIVCWTACYVKGRLQPTRSFGDFYLKYKEYNFTKLAVFTGPYVQATPLITHFKLTDQHKNLILASDGLWDELNQVQIHDVFRKAPKNLGQAIFNKAMQIILRRNRIKDIHQLSLIPKRRDLHDDITLLNIRLQQLRKEL